MASPSPSPAPAADIESQLKQLIVEALMLEDVSAEEIETEAPLFREGLGLDSVDALELAMEIERVFGVRIPDDEQSRKVFFSVSSLARYVAANRA